MPYYLESLEEFSIRIEKEVAAMNPSYTSNDVTSACIKNRTLRFETPDAIASHVKVNAYDKAVSLLNIIFNAGDVSQSGKIVYNREVVLFNGVGTVRNDDRFSDAVYFKFIYVNRSTAIIQIDKVNYKVEVMVEPYSDEMKLDDYKFSLEEAHRTSVTIGSYLLEGQNETFVRDDKKRLMQTCGWPIGYFKRAINNSNDYSSEIISVSYDNNTFTHGNKRYVYHVKMSMPETDEEKNQLVEVIQDLDIEDFLSDKEQKANPAKLAVNQVVAPVDNQVANQAAKSTTATTTVQTVLSAPSITFTQGNKKTVVSTQGDGVVTVQTDENGNINVTSSNGSMFINMS